MDPFTSALSDYAAHHTMPQFQHCVVCFSHIYAQELPERRIRDYDNLELKQFLDVAASFILTDDKDVYKRQLLTFPGRSGTVIYLKNYLSTMFQISDVMIDKEEVAMCLNLRVSVPDTIPPESGPISDEQICVSTELSSVSKPHMLYFVRKVLRTLEAQGISCLSCPKSKYMLYPLSDDCTVGIEKGTISAGLAICCGAGSPLYRFEMTIIPNAEAEGACDNVRKDVRCV